MKINAGFYINNQQQKESMKNNNSVFMQINTIKYPIKRDETTHQHQWEFCKHPVENICFRTMPGNEGIRVWSCNYYRVYPYSHCTYKEKD